MKHIFLLSCFLFTCSVLFAQSPRKTVKKLGNDPLFFIDSMYADKADLQKYDPEQIASVTVFKDEDAKALLGEEGKDGVVYIETKPFARKRYWRFFSAVSAGYLHAVPHPESDTAVVYILNGRVLKEGSEGTLAAINADIFKELTVIDRGTLEKEYGVSGKVCGILISSAVPDNLYKGKKKF